MSGIATSPELERPCEIKSVQQTSTNFEELSLSKHAPWLSSALADLWDLEQQGAFVRGIGDLRIPQTALRVRQVLSGLGHIRRLPIPVVNVFSGGGVTIDWEVGAKEVKYSFWPDGTLSFWMEDNGQTVDGDEVAPGRQFDAVRPLEWLTK